MLEKKRCNLIGEQVVKQDHMLSRLACPLDNHGRRTADPSPSQ
jgi:hypothetical protein